MNLAVAHSEIDSTDAQCTPRSLAMDLGMFDLDVAGSPRSHIQCKRSLQLERGDDGLSHDWMWEGRPAKGWCNGPYSNPLPWCERLAAHQGPWAALWKLDTTTAWFRALMAARPLWAPFRNRIRFERPGNCGVANFASVLVWKGWVPSQNVFNRVWAARQEI